MADLQEPPSRIFQLCFYYWKQFLRCNCHRKTLLTISWCDRCVLCSKNNSNLENAGIHKFLAKIFLKLILFSENHHNFIHVYVCVFWSLKWSSAIKPSGGWEGQGDQPTSSVSLIDQLFLITWGLVLVRTHTYTYKNILTVVCFGHDSPTGENT